MEFQKPSESLSHKALIDAVTHAGFAPDDLRRLLWLINAHPKLFAFVLIAENLEQWVKKIEQAIRENSVDLESKRMTEAKKDMLGGVTSATRTALEIAKHEMP